MSKPLVAFDEAGNTGADLLNKKQPVFALASVHLDDRRTERLLRSLRTPQAKEVHFVKLKRRRAGQSRITRAIDSGLVRPESVKVFVIHKPFMVVTKIVDLLVETYCHGHGIDLYQRGANIALANLLFTTTPVFCGEERFREWMQSFVGMIRAREQVTVEAFYRKTVELSNNCKDRILSEFLSDIVLTSEIVDDVLANCSELDLDPSIPAFVLHCDHWGQQLNQEYALVHDASKPLARDKERLEYLMAKDEPDTEVGYDRRTATYPLKAAGISFDDSGNVPQLQLADLFASASAFMIRGKVDRDSHTEFHSSLEQSTLEQFFIGGVWPSTKVTPKDLGTEKIGGINMVDFVAELAKRQHDKRARGI